MAKIIEITLELNGKEMRLAYKDAEQLYNALKYLFETRVITVPPITRLDPQRDPWVYPPVTYVGTNANSAAR